MEMHPLIRILWVAIFVIIFISIKRILNEKGWKISNFIRIEDDDESIKN